MPTSPSCCAAGMSKKCTRRAVDTSAVGGAARVPQPRVPSRRGTRVTVDVVIATIRLAIVVIVTLGVAHVVAALAPPLQPPAVVERRPCHVYGRRNGLLGRVDDDGDVYSSSGRLLGSWTASGEVFNADGYRVGWVDEGTGTVHGGSSVVFVRADGSITRAAGTWLGTALTRGNLRATGAAALPLGMTNYPNADDGLATLGVGRCSTLDDRFVFRRGRFST